MLTLGRRIELARRRRGLSREVLGDLIGRSSEWIRQVERDTRPVDRLSLLLSLAKVLKVGDIGAFLGSPVPPAVHPCGLSGPAASLRETLYHQAILSDDGRLAGDLDAIVADWHCSPTPYTRVLTGLPRILAAPPAAPLPRAAAYRLAAILLMRLGEAAAALLAAERAQAAARETGDPTAIASCTVTFAQVLVRLDHPRVAKELCARAAESTTRAADAGRLQLTAAEAAVADGDHALGDHLLTQARLSADRMGAGNDDVFGHTEVEASAVDLALGQGRPKRALRLAEKVEAQRLPARERRARHHLTVARAHSREGDGPATLSALHLAEDACPEEIQFNPEARSLVSEMLRRYGNGVNGDVWALAERTGIA